MLIVSGQKLKQLRSVLEAKQSVIIILKGPCGSGKATALAHVCSELGLELHTYAEGDWAEFANRRIRANTVLFGKGYLAISSFLKSIQSIDWSKCGLIVFSINEGSVSDFREVKKIPQPITEIPFHAFSESALANLLHASAGISDTRLAEIARASNGDARQALNQLDGKTILNEGKKRKRKVLKEQQLNEVKTKDTEFSFFHILGKVLYNKNGSGTLHALPAITDSGFYAIETLHENILDFVNDVDDKLVKIMHAFAFADTMHNAFDPNWFVIKTICHLNVCPRKPGGFAPLRKKRDTIRCDRPLIRPEYIGFMDNVLRQTGGVFQGLSDSMRTDIFQFLNKGEKTIECDTRELVDDPIEDS